MIDLERSEQFVVFLNVFPHNLSFSISLTNLNVAVLQYKQVFPRFR